jgi:hypothetical protein
MYHPNFATLGMLQGRRALLPAHSELHRPSRLGGSSVHEPSASVSTPAQQNLFDDSEQVSAAKGLHEFRQHQPAYNASHQ